MLFFHIINLIFLIILHLNSAISLRSFDIRWTRTNCSIVSPSFVALFDCPIIELPKNRGNYLKAHVRFFQDIHKITVDFRVYMPGSSNTKEMELLKFRSDGCQLSKYQTGNPVVNAIVKKLVQSGDFPKGCPLKANFTYTVPNLALNPDHFPGYTPEMNFAAKFNMFSGKMHLFHAHVEASIIKK